MVKRTKLAQRYPELHCVADAEGLPEAERAVVRAALEEPVRVLRRAAEDVARALAAPDPEFAAHLLAEDLEELFAALAEADRRLGAVRSGRRAA